MEVTNECKNQNCRSSYEKLVFAGIVTGLGILLVIFLGILLGSSHKQSADNEAVETMYVPGVYTSSVMIDGNPFDVQVSVDEDHINEITMVHLDETVETMYPLVRPTLDELAKQIISSQSLTDLTYSKTTSIPVVCSSVQYPRHWKRHHPIGDAPHANI